MWIMCFHSYFDVYLPFISDFFHVPGAVHTKALNTGYSFALLPMYAFCYSSFHHKRTESQEPSYVFMKSNQSMDPPLHFNVGNTLSGSRYNISTNICWLYYVHIVEYDRKIIMWIVCFHSYSDVYLPFISDFFHVPGAVHTKALNTGYSFALLPMYAFCYSSVHQKRTESPEPSCVSMKSDQSMDPPLRFNIRNMPSGCSYRLYFCKHTEPVFCIHWYGNS